MAQTVEELYGVHETFAPVPWGILASVCWGDPRSPIVLVVHGLQDNAGSFDRLIPLLPRGFYYVCLELPGHGKSSRMPNGIPLSFMRYVDVIHRFVRFFSWSRFYYLGHSLGGQLGMYYAAIYPEQVIKLIALDTVPFFISNMDDFLKFHKDKTNTMIKFEEKMMDASPPNYTREEALERLIKNRPSPLKQEAAEALLKRMLRSGNGNGYYFSTDQRLKFGVMSYIHADQNLYCISKIQCPALLIMTKITYQACTIEGDHSSFSPIIKQLESMQNVTIEIVDGYHDVHNNEPEVVGPHISNFLVHDRSTL